MSETRIRLLGGPSLLPRDQRERIVTETDLDDRISIPFQAGYEHFEFTGDEQHDTDGHPVRDYRWSYHTAIAE